MNDINNIELEKQDIKVADEVAEEILPEEKDKKRHLFLLIFFLILLIFLISTFSFSFFNFKKVIGEHENLITSGTVLFAYNEGSNYINMDNSYPMKDELGKVLSDSNEFLDFSISVAFDNKKTKHAKIKFEINLTTLHKDFDEKFIRVYLLKNKKEVLNSKNGVLSYHQLPTSNLRENSKTLYKETVESNLSDNYEFRMWVSDEYQVNDKEKVFRCRLSVDAVETR